MTGLGDAKWISRRVPPSRRIVRETRRSRIDWAGPGQSLAQEFRSAGAITAVNLDIAPPRSADPYTEDVLFSVTLRDSTGSAVAEKVVEGPQIVWDSFGVLLPVEPAAPPGDYIIEVRVERATIGWHTSEFEPYLSDDGVSPVPVTGAALLDGEVVDGIRLIGVETRPAPNPYFRRRFNLASQPSRSTLAAAVLGIGVIRINGMRVGEEALEPAVTDYNRTILYRTWEVGHLLKEGENEILIEAGRERFAARGGDVWGWSLAPWHREPMALASLAVDDTRPPILVTDSTWETTSGPVECERFFGGEEWVLRAAEPEWDHATEVDAPSGRLREAQLPPVRELPPVPPTVAESLGDGVTVYDFGKVMVGRIRCRVSGAPGSTVTVVSGEQRGPGGEVVCENPLAAGDAQTDVLRLEARAEGYIFEPQFGYRGFRWMQVTAQGDVTVDQVRAVPLYTAVDTVGELMTNDPLLEWIDAATARTFRNNLHGIPTDTPIYEKNGWTADAHLATEALLHHFDLQASFRKWMSDHRDAQRPDGSIPWIVPTPGWGTASDPAWSASAVLIPWYLYREYGDITVLQESADMIRRFAENILSMLRNDLWRHRTWGDWLAPGYRIPPEGMAPIGTIMCVTILKHASWIFQKLGQTDAALKYRDEADAVAARYHDAYFDEASGSYAVTRTGYRQSLNVLPLAFDAVPLEHRDAVRRSLVMDLESRTEGRLDCGAVAIRHLLPVLSEAGRDDLALTILGGRRRPGWGAWFEAGESTLLESWDADARSRNHYFLGSVAAWIQQRVGGMRLTEPGWRSFEVAPVEDPRVTRASIRHHTPLGTAAVSWQRGPGGWLFDVTVPQGASARVRVASGDARLSPGRHVVRI